MLPRMYHGFIIWSSLSKEDYTVTAKFYPGEGQISLIHKFLEIILTTLMGG